MQPGQKSLDFKVWGKESCRSNYQNTMAPPDLVSLDRRIQIPIHDTVMGTEQKLTVLSNHLSQEDRNLLTDVGGRR